MNILFLYSELGPYNIVFFKKLIQIYNCNIHVFHWDKSKLKPYIPESISGVFYYKKSTYNAKMIKRVATEISPQICYISGWMDSDYFNTARMLKKSNVPVVMGFDDQWIGSLRQKIGSIIFKIYYSKFCTHAWVAGVRQYEFAKKLGFFDNNIIFDLLSCDTDLFSIEDDINVSSNTFLYVGNFRIVKGTDILIKAYKEYRDTYLGEWNLLCIGNGELKNLLENEEGVKVIDYLEQNKLIEYAKHCSTFILPSRHDQWGVVVHEFSSLGLPLILSENVGAKSSFMIENYNGLIFQNNDYKLLAKCMKKMSLFTKEKLLEMSKNSKLLSKRINIETSVYSFMSIVENRNEKNTN